MPTKPLGSFLSFDSGPLQGRIYLNSGHMELAGPDLAGKALANVITFEPPSVHLSGGAAAVGQVVSSHPLPGGLALIQAVGASRVTAHLTFPHDGVMRYEVTDWGGLTPRQTSVSAASDTTEHFYGFGEKFDSLDQAGKRVQILTFDQPGVKGDRSYKVAPWFISTRGYGFHLDSAGESLFDMRASAGDQYTVTNLLPKLKFNVVYGPRLSDVLTRYTGYTGRPPLPPPWAFGAWISSDVWRTGGEIRYAVSKFLENDIPASVFVFDSPWEVAYNDFTFNMAQFGKGGTFEGKQFDGFGSVAEMMEFLRGHGLKVVCWMAPFINTRSDSEGIEGQNLGKAANYDAGASGGFFVRSSPGGPPLAVKWWKGDGSPVDFTNPVAVRWLSGQLEALAAQTEVTTASGAKERVLGGFKTDDGESGNGVDTYIPTFAAYADGRTGSEMQNGYCLEYHKNIADMLGASGILLARSGFTGTQAFPGCWAGDNEPNFGPNGLPSVIVAGMSAAMSGFSIWGHDIGGYQDHNFSVSPPNLFERWAQFGAFSPIMQMHRQVTKNLQYPWSYGPEALSNYQFFARLHTKLFPYIYTYAREASLSGLPILRPLVLLDQTDPNTFSVEHAYHFGNEFLVAPVIQVNARTRQVYLPQGNWLDFWSNVRHTGGQNLTWTGSSVTQFPLFVREGSVVPMLPDGVQTLCDANYVNNAGLATRGDELEFLIYPAVDSSFTVYDGTACRCQVAGSTRTITITSSARPVSLRVLGAEPANVQKGGLSLPRLSTAAEFAAASAGWFFDSANNFLHLRFQHTGGSEEVIF